MKMKSKATILGACAVIAGGFLFANGKQGLFTNKSYNSISDTSHAPIFKTAYNTPTAAQPVDFEKAASAAVPSVVHIKVNIKAKDISGRGAETASSAFPLPPSP